MIKMLHIGTRIYMRNTHRYISRIMSSDIILYSSSQLYDSIILFSVIQKRRTRYSRHKLISDFSISHYNNIDI